MTKWKKLPHTIYQCRYHIVWCPKYRYRILKGALSKYIEQTLRMLCEWKNIEILEMNVVEYHIHMILSIPLKIINIRSNGNAKRQNSNKTLQKLSNSQKEALLGNHFWSRGYCVSTIGLDKNKIRKYVKYQEERERQEEGDQQDFGLF